ncbi:hypothetical protein PVK06_004063 [Gossypium arboreum]|nr:hypothetical protein PVK06_004063 [Gossypium arboreum]
MIHKGKNTRSRVTSKGISAGNSRICYRGLVQVKNPSASVEHEARTSKTGEDMLLNMKPEPLKLVKICYFQQRGIGP